MPGTADLPRIAPDHFGPYRVHAVIAEGGMGVVYMGEHLETSARVAIKTARLPRESLMSGLRREIHALARLQHPGIVPILEQGTQDGIPWYAMPLLEGRTLADLFAEIWRSAPTAFDADAETLVALPDDPLASPLPTSSTLTLIDTALTWPPARTSDVPTRPSDRPQRASDRPLRPSDRPQRASDRPPRASDKPPRASDRPQRPSDPPRASDRPPRASDKPEPPRRPVAGGHLILVLRILRELCETLAFIHGEGLVHRDLKPTNVVLDARGAPVLLDFGLASASRGAVGREELDVTTVEGTVRYMAPEQIRGQLVDARADLYSIGCLLYEALTSRPPFIGSSTPAVVMQQLAAAPRPPSEIVSGVAPALDALVMRLLEKRPRRRPGHAGSVVRALEALGAAPLRRRPAETPRAYVYRPELVGRANALAELSPRLAEARGGRGGAALVSGESGIGKTYLAMALAREAEGLGMLVLTGACSSIATSAGEAGASGRGLSPGGAGEALLHPFRPALQAVADRCRAQGPAVTREILADRGPLLAPVAPELRDLPGQRALPEPPELSAERTRERLLRAAAETLRACARGAPLLVILDDLQWADDLSLDLLDLLVTERIEEVPMFVLGTYRAEEVTHALRTIEGRDPVRAVALERLDAASIGSMVADMLALDDPPAPLVTFLAERSAGNPFHVAEYLRTAVTEGFLRRDEDGRWEVATGAEDASAYERLPLPRSLRELIEHHLAALSAEASALARAASVIGREIDLDLLHEIVSLDGPGGLDPLRELVVREIFEDGGPGGVRFMHDKLREVAYAGLDRDEARALHLRVGTALESSAMGSPALPRLSGRLAHHFARAGEAGKAGIYLRRAAEEALRTFANREARGFLHELIAIEVEALLGPRGARIASDPEAIVALGETSRVDHRARLDLARWERQLAGATLAVGDVEGTARHGRLSLAWAGRAFPKRAGGLALRLPWEVARQAAHRWLPQPSRPAPGEFERALRHERALALGRMAEGAYFSGALFPFAVALISSVNEGELADDVIEMPRRYASLGATYAMLRLERLSHSYFERARGAAEEARGAGATYAAENLAYAMLIEASTLRWQGRWDEARAMIAEGERHAIEAGDACVLERLWITRSLIDRWSGKLRDSLESAARVMRSARDRGDRQNLSWGFANTMHSLIDLGRFDEAAEMLERERALLARDAGAHANVAYLACRTLLALRSGDIAAAESSAQPLCEGPLVGAAPVVLAAAQNTLIELHLARWEALHGYPEEAEGAQKDLRAALADLLRRSFAEPIYALRYLRYRGLAHALAGQPRRSRIFLERARQQAVSLSTPREEACALLALGRLAPLGAARREHLRRAEAIFEQLGCAPDVDACRALATDDPEPPESLASALLRDARHRPAGAEEVAVQRGG